MRASKAPRLGAFLIVLCAIMLACHDVLQPTAHTTKAGALADIADSGQRTIVSPDSLRGWAFVDDQHSTACLDTTLCKFTTGPGRVPWGSGSAELAVPTTSDGNALYLPGYGGTRLSDISTLRYSTYRQTSDAGNNLAIALQ